MQLCRTGAGRSAVALATAATIAAGLLAATSAGAAPTAPTSPGVSNPSDQQLHSADAQKAAIDQQVGVLSGQIAEAQARLDQLQRNQELAEQRVALTVSEARAADERARRSDTQSARSNKINAASGVLDARYQQSRYMTGDPGGMTGALLTSTDPDALLAQSSYQQYIMEAQAGITGQHQRDAIKAANDKAAKIRAQRAAVKAREKAAAAETAAVQAVHQQQDEQAGLEATMSTKQTQLTAAKAQVVQLYNNRATYTQYIVQLNAYNAYVAEQRRKAAEAAARRAAAARAKAAADQARRNHKHHGGHSSNDNNDTPVYSPPAPSGGGWTQAKGYRAVKRAKAFLGDTYAWAGGNENGPTYGVCAGDGAYNDCNIKGFDCSGLVMYAWHQDWAHYADTQYSQAGSYHPSISRLKPGDLLFFGYRGGGSDLHHVAMYVGNKKMIEAPQSNDVIQISSIYKYSDYYGATRPLT